MPDAGERHTRTPGQTAYAAYRQERVRLVVLPPWETLTPDHQYAWDAVAQAVLQWWSQGQTRLGAPGWLVPLAPPDAPATPAPNQQGDAS